MSRKFGISLASVAINFFSIILTNSASFVVNLISDGFHNNVSTNILVILVAALSIASAIFLSLQETKTQKATQNYEADNTVSVEQKSDNAPPQDYHDAFDLSIKKYFRAIPLFVLNISCIGLCLGIFFGLFVGARYINDIYNLAEFVASTIIVSFIIMVISVTASFIFSKGVDKSGFNRRLFVFIVLFVSFCSGLINIYRVIDSVRGFAVTCIYLYSFCSCILFAIVGLIFALVLNFPKSNKKFFG